MTTRGFTIIELMVVILLIGIITAIGIPRFLRQPVPVTQQFIHKLNTLVIQAVEQALESSEARRVFFNISASTVEIQDIAGKPLGGSLEIPDEIQVSDVIINNVSQFAQGGVKRTFYFLINAEGVSQEVRLMLVEQAPQGPRNFEFLLNPFTNIFRVA